MAIPQESTKHADNHKLCVIWADVNSYREILFYDDGEFLNGTGKLSLSHGDATLTL